MQGLRQKQHRWGEAWGIQKRFSQRFCIETVLTQKSSQGYCLEDVAILSQRKSSSREQPSYQLDFQQLGMAYSVAPYVLAAFPIESSCLLQLSPNPGQSIRTFSQAVPKRCQWKIDVRIRPSSRRQNGSDAGLMLGRNPLNFELRVFLQGLRQRQHAWGAAWGIQKRFSQRFCIETVLTQKSSQGYCLEDVAILSQRKSSSREERSYQLDFQKLGMSYSVAPICSSCIPHRIFASLTTFTESRPGN